MLYLTQSPMCNPYSDGNDNMSLLLRTPTEDDERWIAEEYKHISLNIIDRHMFYL